MADASQDTPILWHAAPSRSFTALWMLEEIGRPYDLRVLRLREGEQQQPAFLAINPMGKVPALQHRGVVVTETAAICAYLADAFPEAGLAPPAQDPRRGTYYRWLFFSPSCLEGAMVDKGLNREPGDRRVVGYGNYDLVMDVLAATLGARSPWLCGAGFTAADLVLGSTLSWGMQFGVIPKRPEFMSFVEELEKRPAWKRTVEKDMALRAPAEPAAG